MHANASTAHTCANTTPREEKEREFIELYLSAEPILQAKINALLVAINFHELGEIEVFLADATMQSEERAIIESMIADIKATLAGARFQPVFTKQQVQDFEANEQPVRDAKRRAALLVLCMTEKRMNHVALNDLEVFADLVELTSDFVAISQAQLELAETALNRLMLVAGDYVEIDA